MAISRKSNSFLMGIERSHSQKEIMKIYEKFQFNRSRFKIIIFIQNGIKRMRIGFLMKQEIHAATVLTAFS